MHIRRIRILNGMRMYTKERAHEHLARRLKLPQWYGRNLDALSDCLGGISEPTTILIRNTEHLKASLGDYGAKILSVLTSSAQANENITLKKREHFSRASNAKH